MYLHIHDVGGEERWTESQRPMSSAAQPRPVALVHQTPFLSPAFLCEVRVLREIAPLVLVFILASCTRPKNTVGAF